MKLPYTVAKTIRRLDLTRLTVQNRMTPLNFLLQRSGLFAYVKFDMDAQCKTQWCWAAVAVGISKFHNGGTSTFTQSSLANKLFNSSDCKCSNNKCNEPFDLKKALGNKGTGNLDGNPKFDLPFSNVVNELGINERPLPCRIVYSDGGAHLLVIYAAASIDGEECVSFKDPDGLYDKVDMAFSKFPHKYRRGGQWDLTYLTK